MVCIILHHKYPVHNLLVRLCHPSIPKGWFQKSQVSIFFSFFHFANLFLRCWETEPLFWCLQNLQLNLTLWRLGTLPPALIAFDGNVYPISEKWHMLGLGYNPKTNLEAVEQAAVIHYNGQSKPWLDIAFPQLRPFWSKYVNYSNEFIRQCNILDRA